MTARDVTSRMTSIMCRRSLLALTTSTVPGYRAGWVHHEVARKLQAFSLAVSAGQAPRLILTMPPRHGKSCLLERLVCWHLGHSPTHEIVVAGYGKEPASDRTTAARDCLRDPATQAAFPHLRISADTDGKASWKLRRDCGGGSVIAVGVRGPLTSKGAHILAIDDPVKNWEEAMSPLVRQRAWDWYQSTAYTRLAGENKSGIVIILTRWHEDDLAGRVLELTPDEGWEVVNFPAIAEADEAHRKAGEALHPARFDLETLHRIKRAVGSTKWRALYQQRPSAPSGSIFRRDWWRYWSDSPRPDARPRPRTFHEVATSWDLTFGGRGSSASWVVGQAWGRIGSERYLLAERRGRWGFAETCEQILAMALDFPKARKHFIENKANGPAVIEHLQSKLGRRIKPVNPKGSKQARAHVAAASCEAGDTYIPHPAEATWVHDWIDEHTSFPEGVSDDRVDAHTQATTHMPANRGRVLVGRVS